MNHVLIVPDAWSLIVASLLVVGSAALLALQRVRLWASFTIAALRGTLQLLAVGFVLDFVFDLNRAPAVFGILAIMLVVAAWTVGSRIEHRGPWLRWQVGAALLAGTTVSLLLGAGAALQISPWYNPRYLVPLFGMMLGNSLNAATLAVDRLDGEMSAREAEVETLLALGASARRAGAALARSALRAALLPLVNSLAIVGLVALPGTMTGQILSGTSPLVAVRYQILIWFMVAGTTVLAASILVHLRLRWHFTPAHQLRRREAAEG